MCKKNRYIVLLLFFVFSAVFSADFKQDLSKNVKIKKLNRKQGVEVCIEKIPHINQRQNYCVPATCSMVLRYLDQRYSQKDLGRLFNSSSKNGTYTAEVYKAFQQPEFRDFEIVPIYHLKVSEAAAMKTAYEAALNDPAETGKKAKKYRKKKSRSKDQDAEKENFWTGLDPAVATKVFSVHRALLKKQLVELCREFIDAGIPVMWSVTMTLDPYTPSPNGHMRIINGYVMKNDQITHLLYRDSWRGHAGGNSMPMINVVAMTKSLFAIVPRGLDRQNINRISPVQENASDNKSPAAP